MLLSTLKNKLQVEQSARATGQPDAIVNTENKLQVAQSARATGQPDAIVNTEEQTSSGTISSCYRTTWCYCQHWRTNFKWHNQLVLQDNLMLLSTLKNKLQVEQSARATGQPDAIVNTENKLQVAQSARATGQPDAIVNTEEQTSSGTISSCYRTTWCYCHRRMCHPVGCSLAKQGKCARPCHLCYRETERRHQSSCDIWPLL